MRISKHIHLVDNSFCNVYIVLNNEGYIIIDAGAPENYENVIGYIEKNNLGLNKCSGIIVTHNHHDHIGCLSKLKNTLKTRVIAHKNESPYIDGRIKRKRWMEVENVDVELEVDDGEIIGPLKIIHTPGHTPGSICLYHQIDKTIFIGDLVTNENNYLNEIPTQYSLDPIENRRSIKKIYEKLDFEILLPSHGQPIIGDAKKKMKILVEKLAIT